MYIEVGGQCLNVRNVEGKFCMMSHEAADAVGERVGHMNSKIRTYDAVHKTKSAIRAQYSGGLWVPLETLAAVYYRSTLPVRRELATKCELFLAEHQAKTQVQTRIETAAQSDSESKIQKDSELELVLYRLLKEKYGHCN